MGDTSWIPNTIHLQERDTIVHVGQNYLCIMNENFISLPQIYQAHAHIEPPNVNKILKFEVPR